MTKIKDFLDGLSTSEMDRLKLSIKLRDDERVTSELIEDIVTPNYIGPVWQKNEDGSWLLPEHTLGWEIAGWCSQYLADPNDETRSWKFTMEQLRFVLWWYAIDADGNWLYRSGVLQRRKGW